MIQTEIPDPKGNLYNTKYANDVIKRPRVTYPPDDDDQLGSAEDYEDAETPKVYTKIPKSPTDGGNYNNGGGSVGGRYSNTIASGDRGAGGGGVGGNGGPYIGGTRRPFLYSEVRGYDNEVSTAISTAASAVFNYCNFFTINMLLMVFIRLLS